jgi:hypothetical protein
VASIRCKTACRRSSSKIVPLSRTSKRLSNITSLESLSIVSSGVSSLAGLRKLGSLNYLSLVDTELTDLSGIDQLWIGVSLSVTGNTQLQSLAGFSSSKDTIQQLLISKNSGRRVRWRLSSPSSSVLSGPSPRAG